MQVKSTSRVELERQLKNSERKTRAARQKADVLWVEHKELIRQVYSGGAGELSLQAIADLTNVTKARVWQIVTSYGAKSEA